MDLHEEENSFAEKLCANMNDLVTSFWNKIMRECNLENWTVGDGSREEPASPLQKLLKSNVELPELLIRDDVTDSPKVAADDVPTVRTTPEFAELHAIDSFTDNEEFDKFIGESAAVLLREDSPESGEIVEPHEVIDLDSSSAEESNTSGEGELDRGDSSGLVGERSDSGVSGDHEMERGDVEDFPRTAYGLKRGREDEDVESLSPKQGRFVVGNSMPGRSIVRVNMIGMD
ncbi:hypothetical protein BV898_10736 [Hypsibius exemplaris]|uniref:Uncharacterized protein n=1 Tax=Hypsibius exemplaris TaxID=2072580 RepID=A0A1W0WIT7_HYPEX|nr:hypothetical protein BV898_10736 [Hypsibius exemplaris]